MTRTHPSRRTRSWRLGVLLLLAAGGSTLAGCFDAPRLEDQWTRLDITGANVTAFQTLPLGAPESLNVGVDITYRSIVTGFAIADLRVSPTLTPTMLRVGPSLSRLEMAQDIDTLLAHSYSVGRSTRAVTGWNHLIQHIDFGFRGAVPAVLDSTGTSGGGLFLVCYLGSGQRVTRTFQPETLLVTPFKSAAMKILPIGMAFRTAAGTP